jgi:hypothetical protein
VNDEDETFLFLDLNYRQSRLVSILQDNQDLRAPSCYNSVSYAMATRPSGLPYGTAAGEHDPYQDTDFARILEGATGHSNHLCDQCEAVDFASHFDYFRSGKEETISLNQALRQARNCAFCDIVSAAASKRPHLLETAHHREVQCIVRSRAMGGQPGRPEAHIYPHMTLCVFSKDAEKEPDGSWEEREGERNNFMDFGYNVKDPLLVLEHVGEPPTASEWSTMETPTSDDSDSGSEEEDFGAEYESKISAGWTLRRYRSPIPAQINYKTVKDQLRRQDAQSPGAGTADRQKVEALEILIKSSRLRMIDVHTGDVVILRQWERYLTLSYVWGGNKFQKASVIRAESPPDGNVAWSIDWKHVPKTICETADFVRQLGERYLWVDSLCVDQDDLEDRRAIIPRMMAIYGESYLTVAAAAGSDAEFGLPGVNAGSRLTERPLAFTNNGVQIRFLPQRPFGTNVIESSAWNTRAWTYQEHMLSPRSLFFTEIESHLRLGNDIFGERYYFQSYNPSKPRGTETVTATSALLPPQMRTGLLDALQRPPSAQNHLLTWAHYGEALVPYTLRNLTDPGDRLGAFMGIFGRFCRHTRLSPLQFAALCGLPDQWFYQCLLWQPDNRSLLRDDHRRVRFDATQGRALPSWSWVGWTGRINLPEYHERKSFPDGTLRILDNANLCCDSLTMGVHQKWQEDPTPCPIDPTEAIVLHLFTIVIKLEIRRTRLPPAAKCNLVTCHAEATGQRYQIGQIRLTESAASKLCNGKPHTFVLVDNFAMLVEKHDEESYERIALGRLYDRYSKSSADTADYVKSHGEVRHVKLR